VAALPSRTYPGLVAADSVVEGMLLTGLMPEEWHVLDDFEDDDYELQKVSLADARSSWSYIYPHDDVLAHDWDRVDFERRVLSGYVERCARWRNTQ
jgi:gamma-glutamylcyclotransferase (GGCT)/AIG2-like uncharacterized protein YtfP